MRFKLGRSATDFTACDVCGGKDFRISVDENARIRKSSPELLLFSCQHCAGTMLWTNGTFMENNPTIGYAFGKQLAARGKIALLK